MIHWYTCKLFSHTDNNTDNNLYLHASYIHVHVHVHVHIVINHVLMLTCVLQSLNHSKRLKENTSVEQLCCTTSNTLALRASTLKYITTLL